MPPKKRLLIPNQRSLEPNSKAKSSRLLRAIRATWIPASRPIDSNSNSLETAWMTFQILMELKYPDTPTPIIISNKKFRTTKEE